MRGEGRSEGVEERCLVPVPGLGLRQWSLGLTHGHEVGSLSRDDGGRFSGVRVPWPEDQPRDLGRPLLSPTTPPCLCLNPRDPNQKIVVFASKHLGLSFESVTGLSH